MTQSLFIIPIDEQAILERLSVDDPVHIDDLAKEFPMDSLAYTLTLLALNGNVREIYCGAYIKIDSKKGQYRSQGKKRNER